MSGWVRLENTMPENLKTAPLSDRAFRLWVHSACYCSRNQTDGLVPAAVVCSLSRTATKRTVDELVAARLFQIAEGGYVVNDYLEYNPSRARISELKDAAKKRTSRWRGNDSGDEDVTRHETHHSHVTPHARDRTDPIHSSKADELPEDFPRELEPHLEAVHRTLSALAVRHQANAVSRLSLGSVLMGRPRKPLVRAAHDFAAWADGKGQRRKDVVAGYRNWLDRTDELAAVERLPSDMDAAPVVPLRRPEALRQADAYLDAPEYAKERGA